MLHNLDIVQAQLIDDIKEVPDFFLVRAINIVNALFSPSQWGYVAIILLYVNVILFLLFLFSNLVDTRANALRALLLTAPVLVIGLFFLIYSHSDSKYHDAVLVVSNAYVKTAPSESADDYFIIHEGVKFQLIDEVEDWSRILLADGKDGWVKTPDFQVIK